MKFLKSWLLCLLLASLGFAQDNPNLLTTIEVDTVEDLPALRYQPLSKLDGRVVVVRDKVRGGNFIYDMDATDANNNGTIFSGPGGVGKFFRQHTEGEYHVNWFYAVPNDGDDDWLNIQACITTAVNAKSGGKFDELSNTGGPSVIFDGGAYDISEPIVVPTSPDDTDSKLTIRGQGYFSSIVRPLAGSTANDVPYLFDFQPSGTQNGNRSWTMEDLQLNGINGQKIRGIQGRLSAYFTVRRCSFHYLERGINYRNWSNTIQDCLFRFCEDGIFITKEDGIDAGQGPQSTVNDLRIEGCVFATHSHAGVYQEADLDVNFLKILDCQFDGLTPAGIIINGPGDKLTIDNCYFEAQGRAGPAVLWKRSKKDSTVWANATVYSSHSVVQDIATGAYWYTPTGGTSSGTDVSNDTGVTDWETLEQNVEGAIVIARSRTNTAAAPTITNNIFLNCDLQNTIYLEECRQAYIANNKGSGSFQNHFVTIGSVMGGGSGGAGFSIGQSIYIDHSRWSLTDNPTWSKIVHFESAGSYADLPNEMTGLTIIDRTPTVDVKKTFVLNDLTNSKVWKSDPNYRRPLGRMNDRGMQEFYWDNVGGSMGVVAYFVKDRGSPFDGTYMKQFGNIIGDDGTTNVRVDIRDGKRNIRRMSFVKSEPKQESVGREATVYFEPASPYPDWEPGVTYSVGDIVRSVYRDDEYICTVGGTSGGDDTNLSAVNVDTTLVETSSDTGCSWAELATSEAEKVLEYQTDMAYKAGEIVQSKATGEFHTCLADYTSPGNGTDVDLPGGTGGGSWGAALANDPTQEIVSIRIYGSSETATEPAFSNFALCSASYDAYNAPVKSEPIMSREKLHLSDFRIEPASHRWAYVSLVSEFEQGETITWTGGSARLVFFDQAWDYVLVDRLTGTLPTSGTTFTGSDSGATANSNGNALTSDARSLITAIDAAMLQRKPLHIEAGTYDLTGWGAKSITDDLVVVCDEGVVINGPGVGSTMFSLPVAGGVGVDWTGGKVTAGRRFMLLQTINGSTTPKLYLRDMEFANMASVIEDSAATTPGNLTDVLVENVRCTAVERGFNIANHQFGQAKFENIHMEAGRPVESTPLYGLWLGMESSATTHDSVAIHNFTLRDYENATTNRNHAIRLHGPNFHVSNVRIFDQANGSGVPSTNSEALFLQVSDSTFDDIEIEDGGDGTATVFVDGIDRMINYSVTHDGASGDFHIGETISWDGGSFTGILRRLGPSSAEIEVTGGDDSPENLMEVQGVDSGATFDCNADAVFVGTSKPLGDHNRFNNLRITRSDSVDARAIQMNTSDNVVSNSYFENGGMGVQVKGNRNRFLNSTYREVGSVGSASQMCLIEGANNQFVGNILDHCGLGRGVTIQCEGLISSNCVFADNILVYPTNATPYGLFLRGSTTDYGPVSGLVVSGNQFRGYNNGIRINATNVDRVAGRGNIFRDCTTDIFDAGGTNIDLVGGGGSLKHGTLEQSVQSSSTISTIWTKLLLFNVDGPSNGVTVSNTSDHIQFDEAGSYAVHITGSASTSSTSGRYLFPKFYMGPNGSEAAQNETEIRIELEQNVEVPFSGTFVLQPNANDQLELWHRSDTTSTNYAYNDIKVTVIRLSD